MCDMDDNNDRLKVGGGCCCVLMIVSVSLVAASFGIVETSEYGIHFDGYAFRVKPDVLENGRFFLGLAHGVIRFPRRQVYVEFSNSADGGANNKAVDVWSRDGQEVILEAGFYVRVVKERVVDLYYKYNSADKGFLPVVQDVAANAMRDIATRFDTLQFFTNRSAIDRMMAEELQARVQECCFSDVTVFNLLGIDVPSRFRTAVEDVVISEQERSTLETQRDAIVLRQSIRVVDAQADRQIAIAKVGANAQGLLNRTQASADVLVAVERARAKALYNLSTTLQLGNSSGLLTYLFADNVRASDNVILNTPGALIGVGA